MYERKRVNGKMFVDDLSQSVSLEYFVTQKQSEDKKPQLFFGIEIEKHTRKNDVEELAECEHSGFFSQDRTLVTDVAVMLADNLVTPVTLCYILDDIFC